MSLDQVEMIGDMGGSSAYDWCTDIIDIDESSRIPLDMLLRDFNKINTELKKIQREVDFFDDKVCSLCSTCSRFFFFFSFIFFVILTNALYLRYVDDLLNPIDAVDGKR